MSGRAPWGISATAHCPDLTSVQLQLPLNQLPKLQADQGLVGAKAEKALAVRNPRSAGDELEIRRHERLSPLRVSTRPLGDLRRVRRGDCVVAFSRKGVHAFRTAIEGQGSERCCVVRV